MADIPNPPKHLRADTKRWWTSVVQAYELESHHLKLLSLACEAWDRTCQAREALAEHGLTFTDRLGNPRARPEAAIERDSRLAFARLVRELGLDISEPGGETPRPPTTQGPGRAGGGPCR